MVSPGLRKERMKCTHWGFQKENKKNPITKPNITSTIIFVNKKKPGMGGPDFFSKQTG